MWNTRGSDLWLVHGRSRVNRGIHDIDAGQVSGRSKDQSEHDCNTDIKSGIEHLEPVAYV